MNGKIRLIHGDGGKHTGDLIKDIFYKSFGNDILLNSMDSSVFDVSRGSLAYTTDSYVVKPLFFPGGNIGKLSVCGTINDLASSGAIPLYLSCGFIIEEGFDIDLLYKIAESMGEVCKCSGAKIIAGDTKVVEKGSADGIFINTSGIGTVLNNYKTKPVTEGDQIIITGGIGEHGTTIAIERYQLPVDGKYKSDCMPLNHLIYKLSPFLGKIKLMKDLTRGGLGTGLNEIAERFNKGIEIYENKIPIKKEIISVNNLLGLDPMYLACEGRMMIVVEKQISDNILQEVREIKGCEESAVIGSFFNAETKPVVYMETRIGGKRIIGTLDSNMLPRIC